jgi:hypothetical protein
VDLVDLGEIADALYGLPQGEFTSARDDYVKAARAEGDRELSRTIGKLRRPTAAAWLVNQLAREQPAEVARLADLGSRLRAAHHDVDGAAIRELSRERHAVMGTLVAGARDVGRRDGQPLSDAVVRELEDMFTAALADVDAAAALASGRLTSAKDLAAGVASWPATDPSAQPGALPTRRDTAKRDTAAAKPEAPDGGETGGGARVADLAAARLAKARTELERMDADLAEAEAATGDAQRAADTATDSETAARQAVARLRTELSNAERTEKDARELARAARRGHEDAERALREARKRRDVAANRLAALTDDG